MACRNEHGAARRNCELNACPYTQEAAVAGCPMFRCMMYCPHGFTKDANGCDECMCARPETKVGAGCYDDCMKDLHDDPEGEDICWSECSSEQGVGEQRWGEFEREHGNGGGLQEAAVAGCPMFRCMMYCPHGFTKDANGCDQCMCARPGESVAMQHSASTSE